MLALFGNPSFSSLIITRSRAVCAYLAEALLIGFAAVVALPRDLLFIVLTAAASRAARLFRSCWLKSIPAELASRKWMDCCFVAAVTRAVLLNLDRILEFAATVLAIPDWGRALAGDTGTGLRAVLCRISNGLKLFVTGLTGLTKNFHAFGLGDRQLASGARSPKYRASPSDQEGIAPSLFYLGGANV